ncbi:hypothetical protein ISS22_05720 [candidate division KSB1 bacterium]|nr:hypothetical protein [candidate division KSB1 bacterium]
MGNLSDHRKDFFFMGEIVGQDAILSSDDFEIRNWETYQTIEKIFSSWVK